MRSTAPLLLRSRGFRTGPHPPVNVRKVNHPLIIPRGLSPVNYSLWRFVTSTDAPHMPDASACRADAGCANHPGYFGREDRSANAVFRGPYLARHLVEGYP